MEHRCLLGAAVPPCVHEKTRAHFSRFNPLMIIVCTGNSPVFALECTLVWFTGKVAETNVMRKQPCAGCHVNTPPTFKGFFPRHWVQVLCADQRKPLKTPWELIYSADPTEIKKKPRRFVQALWLTKLGYSNMMMHLLSLHGGKKRTHGLYTQYIHVCLISYLDVCV